MITDRPRQKRLTEETPKVEREFNSNGKPKYDYLPAENQLGFMKTSDNMAYRREHETGTIRRLTPKIRGKAARRADKKARKHATTSYNKSSLPEGERVTSDDLLLVEDR